MRFKFLDQGGDVWAWARQLIGDLNKFALLSDVPTAGQIIWDTTFPIPTGWLECDNATYNVDDYKTLYSVIGYTYGGAGATFKVPNSPAGFTTIIKA